MRPARSARTRRSDATVDASGSGPVSCRYPSRCRRPPRRPTESSTPGSDAHALARARRQRLVEAAERVVVRDGEDRHARGPRRADDAGRREGAVRRRRVRVQVERGAYPA